MREFNFSSWESPGVQDIRDIISNPNVRIVQHWKDDFGRAEIEGDDIFIISDFSSERGFFVSENGDIPEWSQDCRGVFDGFDVSEAKDEKYDIAGWLCPSCGGVNYTDDKCPDCGAECSPASKEELQKIFGKEEQ